MLIETMGAARFGGLTTSTATGTPLDTLHTLFTHTPEVGRDLLREAVTNGDAIQLGAIREAAQQLGTLGNGVDVAAELDSVMARHGTPMQQEAHATEPRQDNVVVTIDNVPFGTSGQTWEAWKREDPEGFQTFVQKHGGEEAAKAEVIRIVTERTNATLDTVRDGAPRLAAELDKADGPTRQWIAEQFDKLPAAEQQAYRQLAAQAKVEGATPAGDMLEAMAAVMLLGGLPSARVATMPAAQLASEWTSVTGRLAAQGSRTPAGAFGLAVGLAGTVALLRPSNDPVANPTTAHANAGSIETFPDQSGDAAQHGQVPPSMAHVPDTGPLWTPALPPLTPPLVTPLPTPNLPPLESFPAAGPQTPIVLENRPHWPLTQPSGVKGGEPLNERETIKPNADARQKTSIKAQTNVADALAQQGYVVRHTPDGSWTPAELQAQGLSPKANPDLNVEGNVFDVYRPLTGSTGSAVDGIMSKVEKLQTKRVVVDLSEGNISRAELENALRGQSLEGLKEVLTVDQDGTVGRAYP